VIDGRELRTSSGRYVERLLHYLQAINSPHDFQILLKPEDVNGWQPTAANFSVVPCPHKEFSFDEQLGLKRQIQQLKPDLVHFTFPQQPIWYRGRTVTTIHDLTTLRFSNPAKNAAVFKIKQRVYAHVIKRAAQKAQRVLTPSEFVKSDLVNFSGISPDKVTVTLEAADAIVTQLSGLSQLIDKKFIMYVGRPTPHKNLARLVEAFAMVDDPDLLLVLAGKKDTNYEHFADGVPDTVRSRIVFTDFVDEGQLRWLYENCAAYIFPSLSEGFGLPGLEAMAHGAPVVSSNATCLPEIYGDAARYFNPLDVPAMARAIKEVLSDQMLRDRLVATGREQVKKYSWQRMAEQTLASYNDALRD